MDGYLHHDQFSRTKFRLFHLLLEICESQQHIFNEIHVGTYWFRISSLKPSRNELVLFHIGYKFHFRLDFHASWLNVGDSGFANVCDMCYVSVANNFTQPQTATVYGFHSFVQLARFTYCLFQKIKQGYSLPLVEQWQQYVVSSYSKFPPISDEEFLSGTRVLTALNQI